MWDQLEPYVVTPRRLRLARLSALQRIRRAKLATKDLSQVPVRLGLVPFSLGEYWFESGTIFIPCVSLYRTETGPCSLVETLIHEYGHAAGEILLERNEHFTTEFAFAFCRKYAEHNPVSYRACSHVNEYAATCGLEDFAETYLALVRENGEISGDRPKAIQRKLRFVQAWAKA